MVVDDGGFTLVGPWFILSGGEWQWVLFWLVVVVVGLF